MENLKSGAFVSMAAGTAHYVEIQVGENESLIVNMLRRYADGFEEESYVVLSFFVMEIVRYRNNQYARIFWGGSQALFDKAINRIRLVEKRAVLCKGQDAYTLYEMGRTTRIPLGQISSVAVKERNKILKCESLLIR